MGVILRLAAFMGGSGGGSLFGVVGLRSRKLKLREYVYSARERERERVE